MGLDFGGFGKEFAVDQVSEKLKSLSCKNYLIDFGGDIFPSNCHGDSPWRVGIEMPSGGNPAFIVNLCNQALLHQGTIKNTST